MIKTKLFSAKFSKSLVKDETPMVHPSTFKCVPARCETLPSNIIIGEVAKELLTQALQNNEDSVRLLPPASLSVISGKRNNTERAALIIRIIKSIVNLVPGGFVPVLPMNFRRLRNHFPSIVL
jgi:hypothetical protein